MESERHTYVTIVWCSCCCALCRLYINLRLVFMYIFNLMKHMYWRRLQQWSNFVFYTQRANKAWLKNGKNAGKNYGPNRRIFGRNTCTPVEFFRFFYSFCKNIQPFQNLSKTNLPPPWPMAVCPYIRCGPWWLGSVCFQKIVTFFLYELRRR
jgi:hypothetical protein